MLTQLPLLTQQHYLPCAPCDSLRLSQIFINLVDNSRLDASGFAPFATVVEGMDIVNNLINPTPGDSNGVDQDLYTEKGDEYIEANYAGKINKVVNVSIIV